MKYTRLCLMVPTYKRCATSLPIYIDSAINKCASLSNICMSFCVNVRDDDTKNYLDHKEFPCEYEVLKENTVKPNLAEYFNTMYRESRFKDPSIVISMLGDDMEFLTKGYDGKLLEIINAYNGVGVFWGNDDFIARERMCVNMFVTRKFVEATGESFMCEKYPADMIDYLWFKVGQYSKSLHFLPDVHIKHNHTSAKPKEKWDETYRRLRPAQGEAHRVYGKGYAKELAAKIAKRLAEKGMTGDNK